MKSRASCPPPSALEAAEEAGLDLVEVSPNSDPPVCKILDYGKYKFQEQKKKNEARKRQKLVEIKEIKLRPNIDPHDYEVKAKAMHRFFEEGDKVKVTLRFRGGEMRHPELGMKLLQQVQDRLRAGGQGRVRAAHGRPPDDHDPGAAIGAGTPVPRSGRAGSARVAAWIARTARLSIRARPGGFAGSRIRGNDLGYA